MSGAPARLRPAGVVGRKLTLGWTPALLFPWLLLNQGLTVVVLLAIMRPDVAFGWAPALFGVNAVVSTALAIAVFVQATRWAPDLRGGLRVLTAAAGSVLRSIGLVVVAAALLWLAIDAHHIEALYPTDSFLPLDQQRDSLSNLVHFARMKGVVTPLYVGLALAGLGTFLEAVGLLSSWFLLPAWLRRAFWAVVDSLLLLGTVALNVVFPVPLIPAEGDAAQVYLAALRLGVSALLAVRLLARFLPDLLGLLERTGFRLKVAARMMRAKRSGFLTAIGGLSIGAVTVSTTAMVVVLSVMGGFRNDLKEKILGNNAHVVVDRERGTFEGWDPVLDAVRAERGVTAATPYVGGEVMITSATNHAGAILRGIDPGTIGDVTLLRENLRHGDLEYLSDPELLLDLPVEEMGRDLLELPALGVDPAEEGGLLDEVAAAIDEASGAIDEASGAVDEDSAAAPPDGPDDDLEAELRPFLLEPDLPDPGFGLDGDGFGPATDLPDDRREVLPGLIVGQELARNLRLHVGDEVNVGSPLGDLGPSGPLPRTRPFRVAGIFYSGMYEYDMKMAYTSLEAAQRFLSAGDAISAIEVRVERLEDAERAAEAIEGAIARDDLRVRAWQEVNRTLFGALALEKLAMFITLGIAILVAGFCIIGTLTLMVQEKGPQVGVLKAMGATREQVVAVFMAQGLMIGLLGASIGLGLGYLACFVLKHIFRFPLEAEVYYIDRLPVHVDPVELGLVWVSAVVVCLLAAVYPAILGSLLRPVDALRYA
ncbi:MAG: FtsX-like permease family protein [Sandaracinaceae bacterium]